MNLSALYLSLKRLSELVDLSVYPICSQVGAIREVDGGTRASVTYAVETAALEWIDRNSTPTLGELLATDRAAVGAMFTHFGSFYGRGAGQAAARYDQGKPIKDAPYLWMKLDSFLPGTTLRIQVHPENMTTASAPGEFGHQNQLLLLGRLTNAKPPTLTAQAYMIGFLYDSERASAPSNDRLGRLSFQMELFPSLIDNFKAMSDVRPPSMKALHRLKEIPEVDIKHAFSEIIGEPFVPKDWGGERSDLVSSQLSVNSQQFVTAFAFKGPAVFRPLTVADLGKNGDQISRLFSEPADLVVLQHCHNVTSAVRDHMRAFGTRIGRLKPFSIIDGSDTVRILSAFRKCGF